MTFGFLLLNRLRGLGLDLAGSLVLGQIELFLDLALATAQVLVVLLLLERCADFCFKLLRALLGVGNIRLQLGGTFLETLDGGLPDAIALTSA